jgi:hypothetical protein
MFIVQIRAFVILIHSFCTVYVLNQLAALRGVAVPSPEFDALAKALHDNSKRVFGLQVADE